MWQWLCHQGDAPDQAVIPAQWHGVRCSLAVLQLTWSSFNFSFSGDR